MHQRCNKYSLPNSDALSFLQLVPYRDASAMQQILAPYPIPPLGTVTVIQIGSRSVVRWITDATFLLR